MGFVLATAFVMVRLNTIHAIMRTYSRMISCSFLAISLIALPYFLNPLNAALPLCLSIIFTLLFFSYQDKTAVGIVFLTFVVLSIASLIYIKILLLVPILWIIIATRMMAMSPRVFFASLLGIVTPYWFYAAYCLYADRIDTLTDHVTGIADFTNISDISTLSLSDIAIFVIVTLLFFLGMTHFILTSHNDKIRTRMIFESFIITDIALLAFIILQPAEMECLVPMMAVGVSPLVAHYVTYTSSRLSNLSFLGMILIVVLSTAYHLWTL